MRLPGGQPDPLAAGKHPGIRVRISIVARAGALLPLLDADSDMLHYMAHYSGPQGCQPSCRPGCDLHGWHNLLSADEMNPDMVQAGDLVIQVKPVRLANEEPDAGQIAQYQDTVLGMTWLGMIFELVRPRRPRA